MYAPESLLRSLHEIDLIHQDHPHRVPQHVLSTLTRLSFLYLPHLRGVL